MAMLRRVKLNGFKSIKAMDLKLSALNVLIGANGAGKSTLLSFFKMLNELVSERLQLYIATSGRAHSLLHYGPKVTSQLEAQLEFDGASGPETYDLRLVYAANDALVIDEEKLHVNPAPEERIGLAPGEKIEKHFSKSAGHREETVLNRLTDPSAMALCHLLGGCRLYHFH
jgi:predicted ATPase